MMIKMTYGKIKDNNPFLVPSEGHFLNIFFTLTDLLQTFFSLA